MFGTKNTLYFRYEHKGPMDQSTFLANVSDKYLKLEIGRVIASTYYWVFSAVFNGS